MPCLARLRHRAVHVPGRLGVERRRRRDRGQGRLRVPPRVLHRQDPGPAHAGGDVRDASGGHAVRGFRLCFCGGDVRDANRRACSEALFFYRFCEGAGRAGRTQTALFRGWTDVRGRGLEKIKRQIPKGNQAPVDPLYMGGSSDHTCTCRLYFTFSSTTHILSRALAEPTFSQKFFFLSFVHDEMEN